MNNAKEIRLRFEAGKGGAVGLSAVTALSGDRVGALPRPARRGYAFRGWYTVPDGQAGGRLVESSTVLDEDTPAELTLYAHWVREKQKKSAFLTQKRAVVALVAAVVLLIGGLIVTNYIVSLPDPFVDEDGTVYPVRKQDGAYALYNKGGDVCDRNQDGYYLTRLGTQLSVDAESGECTVYAVVETEGTEIVGTSQRVLAFKQLTYDKSSTTDLTRVIASVEIHNQYGVMDLYRPDTDTNRFMIRGHEGTLLSDELFAQLSNGCGYTLSLMRLEEPVRLADGSIDYAEYGLAPETRVKQDENGDPVLDEDGNEVLYDYTPTWYTIKTMEPDAATGLDSYTMTIGDAIVSGAGYYARYEGRDVIYVLSSTNLDAAVLQPIETLVTPMVCYPMTMNTYFSVENFILRTDIDYDKITLHIAAAYAGILNEEGMDLDHVEDMPDELKDQLTAALQTLSEKLADEDDEDFIKTWEKLYANALEACSHKMTAFSYVELDDRSDSLLSSYAYYMVTDYMTGYRPNSNKISSMLQNLYSLSPDAVTKLAPSDEDMEQYGLSEPAFDITYTYIDESEQKHSNHLIFSARTEDGTYYAYGYEYDMIVEVDEGQVPFLGWDEIDWYDQSYFNYNIAHIQEIRLEGQAVSALDPKYLTEDGDIQIRFDNSRSDQSDGTNSEKLIAYVNGEDTSSYTMDIVRATGRVETMEGTQNVRYFVQSLLTASIEGDIELTDEEMAALRESDDETCYLKFTVILDDGLGTSTSTANLVYRFYRFSERKCYMTIESLATPDADSSPEKGQGRFYVLRSFCEKLVADTVRLQEHEQVYPDTKN